MVNSSHARRLPRRWPPVPAPESGPSAWCKAATPTDFDATFRLAWDEEEPLSLHRDLRPDPPDELAPDRENLWNGDAVELFIGHEDLDRGGPPRFSDRQVSIRGARPRGVDVSTSAVHRGSRRPAPAVPNLEGKGYTLEAAIPFAALGFEPQPNQELLFYIAVDDSDRTGPAGSAKSSSTATHATPKTAGPGAKPRCSSEARSLGFRVKVARPKRSRRYEDSGRCDRALESKRFPANAGADSLQFGRILVSP